MSGEELILKGDIKDGREGEIGGVIRLICSTLLREQRAGRYHAVSPGLLVRVFQEDVISHRTKGHSSAVWLQ